MANVTLFGGCNGAGKTTLALSMLPVLGCRHFINADSIEVGLSPLRGGDVQIKAGFLMMGRLRELRDRGEDFATESTLAARAFVPFLRECQERGYTFHLIYVWLPSTAMAQQRVVARVKSGGHDIPPETIARRYEAGRRNFLNLYRPLSDLWAAFDNSQPHSRLIAYGATGQRETILDEETWMAITR